ncbi:degenerin del-1-like [Palaemon carinicauda]|uniref:degenerin del-1-like n=1 Tax=Palaemon carinicauda TaxID=392227 RepID=UPI0035B590B0
MEAGPSHILQVDVNLFNGLFILSAAQGLRVIIHNPRRLPFPDEEGFNVAQEIISVSVARTVIKHYGENHGFCRAVENNKGPAYSQILCKKLCKEREYRSLCGCAVNTGPNYEELEPTGSEDESLESRNLTLCSNFNIQQKICKAVVEVRYKTKQLGCDCPPACREDIYKPQVTTAFYGYKYRTILHNYRKKIDTLCTPLKGMMMSLQVYLDSLSYELICESPSFTWESLIGTVGGTLGLVIGLSVVTVLEFVEFLLDVAFMFCRRRRRRRGKKSGGGVAVGGSREAIPPGGAEVTPTPSIGKDAKDDRYMTYVPVITINSIVTYEDK